MPKRTSAPAAAGRPRGPYVGAAVFAERVIMDQENVPTVVRAIDKMTYHVPADAPPNPTFGVHIWAFLAVKAGDAVGEHVVSFQLFDPDGELAGEATDAPTAFTGPADGLNIVIELRLRLQKTGTYWADLSVDHEVLTRMPLQVLAERSAPEPAQPAE